MSVVKGKASSHANAESSNQSSKMNVFGLEDDLKKIKGLLTGGQEELFGIAISGKIGSGKTTLARLVYEDVEVSHHFERRAWFPVGTKWKAIDVLESLLYSLASGSKTKEEIKGKGQMTMVREIEKEMVEKRCLIVLDDVCSSGNDIWNQGLKFVLGVKEIKKGSRIIITTRMSDFEGYKLQEEHNMSDELLAEAKWELFKRSSKLPDPDLQPGSDIEKIIRNCYGLPLAIVLIASMCRGKKPQDLKNKLSKFQRVEKDLNKILDLIYEELPDPLMKRCLRYLGRFPPEKEISVEKLCLHWVAEGIISTPSPENGTKLDEAKAYCNKLIGSSLVIKEERGAGGASCKLLQSIHGKCQKLSKDEDSVEVLRNGNISVVRSCKKLAIYLDTLADPNNVLSNIKGPEHIESILFFDVINMNKEDKRRSVDLKKFKSTKVLDFNGVCFSEGKCPRHMEKLKCLKYLSFQGCYLPELPSSIKENDKLETLDLGVVDDCKMVIPDELGQLTGLRHLCFPRSFQTKSKSKLKLQGAEDLEILENFDPGKCDSNDLKKLKKLQRLTCIEVEKVADLENILDAIKPQKDIHTSLAVKNFDAYSKKKLEVVKRLFECNGIHILDIHGNLGDLPNDFKIGSNFTEMVLNGSQFPKEPLPLLQTLPNLQSLVLCDNAFKAPKMTFQCQLFPQLKSLTLKKLNSLKELEVKEAVSSPLAVLTINNCEKLKKLPCNELAEMKALKKLITGVGGKYDDDVKKINSERKKKGYTCLSPLPC